MYVADAIAASLRIVSLTNSYLPIIIFLASLLAIAFACILFWKAKTTANPIVPEKASSLVTTGIYSLSRNPMYVAFTSVLIAFALFLSNPINLLLLPVFVFLVNRLYIFPEEQALKTLFAEEFIAYKSKVRRWI